MKYIIILAFLIASNHALKLQKSEDSTAIQATKQPEAGQPNSTGEVSESVAGYNALIDKIYEYAKELSRDKEDPEKRRIKAGMLSDFYPKAQRDQAKKMAEEKKANGYNLKYLTEIYRFCMFPYSEVNAMTYCDNTFKKVSENRAMDCKHMMCINCCDHLLLTLKYSASQSIVSQVLGLANDAGFNKMKGYVTQDIIQKCRKTCANEFPVTEPQVMNKPPQDATLGKTADNAAKSCMDAKENGIDASNGEYYVQDKQKPATKVYCDMVTEGGGWTLFFSYAHHPGEGQDFVLDGNKMPTDPKNGRSHMTLQQNGFDEFDVAELRFYCSSSHNKPPKFVHFSTTNPLLLKVAMNGDQKQMTEKVWKTHQNIDIPADIIVPNMIRDKMNEEVTKTGTNPAGFFWDTPFQSETGAWTVKGKSLKWECGDLLDGQKGSEYETLHQVWFRGAPPSREFTEARALLKKQSGK